MNWSAYPPATLVALTTTAPGTGAIMPKSARTERTPEPRDIELAKNVLPTINEYLAGDHDSAVIRIVPEAASQPAQEPLELSRNAVELFVDLLTHIAMGESVSIVPAHAELTTQQAADLLNVSRPYLIKLLDEEEIEYRTVGTHRRIRAESLRTFQLRDSRKRKKIADELSSLDQEMGLT